MEELGNWSSNKKEGLDLKWSNGNIWKGQIPFNEKFEFKFVFVQNENITKWEQGENRIFKFRELNNKINNEELDKDGKINFSNDDCIIYEYDKKQEKISVKCSWKN